MKFLWPTNAMTFETVHGLLTNFKLRTVLRGAFLILLLTVAATHASADSFNFNVQNGALSGPGPWGTITLTQDGSNVDVNITAGSGLSVFGMQGAIAFADSGLVITGISSLGGPGVFIASGSSCNMDGFGSGGSAFGSCITDGNLGTGSATSVSFVVNNETISALEGLNTKGYWIAIHEGPTGGSSTSCTGYASVTINNNTVNSNTGTSSCTAVPEPSSISMLGAAGAGGGFAAIFWPWVYGLRRRRKDA